MTNDRTPARKDMLKRHVSRLQAWIKRLEQIDQRYFLTRLIVFGLGFLGVVVAFIFGTNPLRIVSVVLFLTIFGIVVFLHRKVDRSRKRFQLALTLASSQLARMELHWEAIPDTPASLSQNGRPAETDHPFANDLNLIGKRSLHQLMDTATSLGGSERLKAWLLNLVPDPEIIMQRQTLLREMLPLTRFRDRLALIGMLFKEENKQKEATHAFWNGERLLFWLEKGATPRSLLPTLILMSLLALVNILLLVASVMSILPPYWILGLAIYATIYLLSYPLYKDLFRDTYIIGRSLDQFRSILLFLEKFPYPKSGHLAKVCEPLCQTQHKPSKYLKKIVWLTTTASLGDNQIWALLLNTLAPWNLFFTYILQGLKKELRGVLPGWLNSWYEVEALNSIANYAYLNPDTTIPKVFTSLADENQPVFEAQDLGHPLLAIETRICNMYKVGKMGEVAIITGSNMAGKSTFLRTIGVNLCLAYAGAPVNATTLRTIPLRIFTCIQVSDSLADGISYFYAEVLRLKGLLEALKDDNPVPLCFLIDEIYRGTNNQERRTGSHALIRVLTKGNGIGVISTHDLELVNLADEDTHLKNYHFRDEVIDGRMVFDYLLHPGPCPTTNALKIMELEGLPVDANEKGE
jgi:Flp pilus assembly protein TadB